VFSGKVTEYANYHHGDKALHDTIINMAQDFQNTNNIPLMQPEGHFGNVLGDLPGGARYISIKRNPLINKIFPIKFLDILPYDYSETED
jgi:DNA topoisomerase-2